MDPVELRDDRLLLRQARPEDAEAVTAACQDPETQRWIPVPVPYEEKYATEWIGQRAQAWDEDKELNWIVAGAADGALLGTVSLHAFDESMREIGFWTAPWARRQGVTTDAVRMVCRWGFEGLGLQRIEWWAAVGNWGSRRIAERLGFTVEGTCRARLLHRGERLDGWVGGLRPGELR